MKALLLFGLIWSFFCFTSTQPVVAQTVQQLQYVVEDNIDPLILENNSVSTQSATFSGAVTTSQPKESDITQPSGETQQTLTNYLFAHPPSQLNWYNPLQHLIFDAVRNGLSANLIVLLLLFPLIAALIAFSRHVVGLEGYGVYTPAVLSVAFVSTGIPTGITIFVAVLAAALLSRFLIKRLRLQYLPRTALMLWGVALAVMLFISLSSALGLDTLQSLNIFPLLIIILLSENFMETQLMSTRSKALRLTFETLVLAALCSLIISFEPIQRLVILNPELTVACVALITIAIGRYTGLRLLERIRFKPIIDS